VPQKLDGATVLVGADVVFYGVQLISLAISVIVFVNLVVFCYSFLSLFPYTRAGATETRWGCPVLLVGFGFVVGLRGRKRLVDLNLFDCHVRVHGGGLQDGLGLFFDVHLWSLCCPVPASISSS